MPEPGMGSVGGGGLGGGLLSDRDDKNDFSFEDRRAARSGYSGSYDKGPGAAGPQESYSAIPAVKSVAKPDTSKTTFYLDETPAFSEQKVAEVSETLAEKQGRLNKNAATRQQNNLVQTSMMAGADYSGATAANKAAAERERTMGATMGGGPSYDPLRPDPSMPAWAEEWGQESEMTASSAPLTFTNVLRTREGYTEPVWKPEYSKWSDARKADWMAGFDKTLGAAGKWSEEMQRRMENQLGETINKIMEKHVNNHFAVNELYGSEYNSLRDVIRHGIATNKHGLALSSGYYETFKSGQELSDYQNNYEAYKFAKTLGPNQNFDDEWAAAVVQEKMNPGSTGLTINFKAGTENDPTVGEAIESWWSDKWAEFKNNLPGASNDQGMITQVEQGGG